MKRIIALLLPLLAAFNLHAAAEYDLRKGIDLTGVTSVTASQLNQLVDAGTVYNSASLTNGRGLIIRSSIVPDVVNNPRYTNFMWLDVSSGVTGGLLKQYTNASLLNNSTAWSQITAISQIADGSVTIGKLGENAVQTTNIAAGAVTESKIADGAITLAKMANGSVSNQHIVDLTIQGGKIGYQQIASTNLAASAVLELNIGTGVVTSNKVANSNILGNHIGIGTITSNNVANSNILGNHIGIGTITSNNIAAGTINSSILNTNFSYGAAAAWVFCQTNGTIKKGFGVSSVIMTSDGRYSILFNTARTSTNYITLVTPFTADGGVRAPNVVTNLTDRVAIEFRNAAAGLEGPRDGFQAVIFDF